MIFYKLHLSKLWLFHFRIIAANRQLEKRVLRRSKKEHTERLDFMENEFTQRVANLVEDRVFSRVQDLLVYPVVSTRSTRARVAQNLELLAMMKEYTLNYETSPISKGRITVILYIMVELFFLLTCIVVVVTAKLVKSLSKMISRINQF
jgi:hypothetical protein